MFPTHDDMGILICTTPEIRGNGLRVLDWRLQCYLRSMSFARGRLEAR